MAKNESIPAASQVGVAARDDGRRMVDIPLSPNAEITVEPREQIVLIGINRPQMFNRIDPEAFYGLAKTYYDFDNDSTLRAAVLFGHGENFSRGNDVEAFAALAKSGHAFKLGEGQIDPLGRAQRAHKTGIVQEIAPDKDAALKVGIDLAGRIAACGPLGIKATLKVAHLGVNDSADAAAFAELESEYVSLFRSEDFSEGRKAEAENRPPVFHGR
jgi:enoyl-CoA hydratase/carnithine racemase